MIHEISPIVFLLYRLWFKAERFHVFGPNEYIFINAGKVMIVFHEYTPGNPNGSIAISKESICYWRYPNAGKALSSSEKKLAFFKLDEFLVNKEKVKYYFK